MKKTNRNNTGIWRRIRLSLPRVRRNYKDALFIRLFCQKEDLLSLYNALNGTQYADTSLLTVTTIENVVFLGYKNDVSFIIESFLNLYEHQSTFCPNLPLRGLFYFSALYQKYVEMNGFNLYGSARIVLPTPKYVIFYNGEEEQPDRQEMRLTDSFPEPGACLECIAFMYNINHGHNKELLTQCSTLEGYAVLISMIRQFTAQGYSLRAAMNKAIDYCIEHDYIRQFLLAQKGEVMNMLLTEYNPKKQRMMDIRDAKAEGRTEGRQEGLTLGRQEGLTLGRQEGLTLGRQEGLTLGRTEAYTASVQSLMQNMHISEQEAMQLLNLSEEQITQPPERS